MDHGAAQRHRIEPAAAARAAGDRAELMAHARQVLARGIEQLGGKRTRAHARGIGLHDAQHVVEAARPEARAGGRAARRGVGGSDERIGAVIDVEHRALRAFEQHIGALLAQLGQLLRHIHHQRLDALALRQQRVAASPASPAAAARNSRVSTKLWKSSTSASWSAKRARIEQVGHAQRATRHLVFVGRTDAAAGGADGVDRRAPARAPCPARHARAGSAGSWARCAGARTPARRGRSASGFPSAAPRATAPRHCRCSSARLRAGCPEGISDRMVFWPSMTSVWPALCPPWKRATAAARSVSRSTTLPLPSSPHCVPMTMTKRPISDSLSGPDEKQQHQARQPC